MENKDISLLFGVLGDGKLSGESGKLIQRQLTQIMTELNKNPLKVKIGVDTDTGGKKSWSGQLQEKLDKLSASGKFSVQISTLKLSAGAVTDFKKQLGAIIHTLGLSTGTEITISAKGIGEIKSKLEQVGSVASDATKKIAGFKAQMEALGNQESAVKNYIEALSNGATEDERGRIAEIAAQYEQWAAKIEKVRAAKTAAAGESLSKLEAEGAAISANISRINEERMAREGTAQDAVDSGNKKDEENKKELASQKQINVALRSYHTLLTQMEKAERDWTAAQTGRSKTNYENIQSDIKKLRAYHGQNDFDTNELEKFKDTLSAIRTNFAENSNEIKKNAENVKTLGSRLGGLAQKFSAWLSVSQVIMLGVRSVRRMATATIELDDAMTQLKIVTRDTDSAYRDYLETISRTAAEIGAAIPDLIDSTTTFARLGYSLEESSALAEYTAMLQNVGDIDVTDAQNAITAIVKAFGVSIDEIESIMDKLVITGNNFPISVSQIAEGMNNASSALAAAGNTFEQSVALLTAANTTIQDAAKSSTGLRTIAARIRSTKTELDELGEAMTDAEYGDLVAALTKYNVALTDMNGEFRSTYDIVADIAAKWDELSSMEQAALANAIAGVRQQSVFYSMVEQFQEASGAMDDMANSAGTLQESYAAFMESTTAHINQFKAAFQSLGQSVITTDFLNTFIDMGTNILKILDGVTRLINAVGGLNTVLIVTAGILAIIKANSIAIFLSNVKKNIGRLANDILGVMQIFSSGFAQATAAGSSFFAAVGAGLKGVISLATTAQLVVGAIVAVLGIALIAYNSYKRSVEETRQRSIDAANAAEDLTNELSNLANQYIELSEAVKTNGDAKEELLSTQNELIDKLGLEKDELQELVHEYGNLDDAIKAATIESLQDAERDLRGGLNASGDAVLEAGKPSGPVSESMNLITETWSKDNAEVNRRVLDALAEAGYISSKDYGPRFMNLRLPSDGGYDLSTIEGVINAHNRLGEMMDIVEDKAGSQNEVYDALFKSYNKCSDAIGDYQNSITALNDNLAHQYMIQGLIGKEIPNTKDEFDAYRQSVIDAANESKEFIGSDADIVGAIDDALSKQVQFAGFYADQLSQATDGTGTYTAQLSKLTEVISGLKSSYDALEAAQKDMAGGGGLSIDTIEKLASVEKNYLDYLYEENGVVKLNTEAWRENANAKMQGEIGEIQKEIDSLEEQNDVLRDNISYYEEQRKLGSDGGLWNNMIVEATNQINENTEAIAENQGKLAIYSSLFGSMTGELDAYNSALASFSNIADTIDSISNSFQTLADLQAQVANGFTMSLDKALEFASVYPEILNNAQVSADGQITLNEGVVGSFLQGKKAELDAQIDSQISQLEADKAVLEAKMEAAQAQLEVAKNVGEGEGQVTKEVAEYRIKASNEMAKALIENGIDEAEAYKSAAQSMSLNTEEFSRVAAEVCTDVDGNFNSAAYNAAMGIYENMERAKTDISSVAKQAHESAKAIKAMADGTVDGSSKKFDGSGGGKSRKKIKTETTSGEFNGFDFDFDFKGASLDKFISQIELDLSSYQDAIAQIDGQIAVLQSLKNAPLKSFESGSGGGSGKGASDAKKEVEEYIASIDDYREALERLKRIQIKKGEYELQLSNTDDLNEQIRLQEALINIYRDEQDALHSLNDLRDQTISNGSNELRQLGFDVEYDPDKNRFFVENLEHLNELVADSKGEYDSLQEATNALKQETEDLADSLDSLNKENQEGSESWLTLQNAIRDAKVAIVDNLKQIVTEASGAVDEIRNVYDTLKSAADEYAENGGYISVDAFQKIVALGPQYMQYLRDENGLLVINEGSINKVIEAKTRQLALENAMSYVERLRLALQEGSIENLDNLLYAVTESTDATWGLVYANLALLDLDGDQYAAALHNINAIRSLADSAAAGIGKVSGSLQSELEDMKSGLDDILKYVMDMLKQKVQDQIDALEDMKTSYAELIQLKKDSIQAAKQDEDYQRSVADKVKEMADLQAKIDALSLDNSRDAQAKKAALLEKMNELQEGLADQQAEYAIDRQEESLDDMQKSYEKEKDKEIKILEDSVGSYQKLYDMAIDYIQNNWDTLYNELISWNTQYGSVLNTEITTAWDNCLAAARRYGSYVQALGGIEADLSNSEDSSNGGNHNTVVGDTSYDNTPSTQDSIRAIVSEMKRNSQAYMSASPERRKYFDQRNMNLGNRLSQYGVSATRGDDGVWYIDRVGGQRLYDKYHSGGIAGGGTLKENEMMATLEKGEPIISNQNKKTLFELIDFMSLLSKQLDTSGLSSAKPIVGNNGPDVRGLTNSNVANIQFGDVIINGGSEETVRAHQRLNREFTNEVLKQLNIKR